jgi:hypothetical protein
MDLSSLAPYVVPAVVALGLFDLGAILFAAAGLAVPRS